MTKKWFGPLPPTSRRKGIFVYMNKQLLLVDDSVLILSRVKALLEDIPGIASILEAHSYQEAVAVLDSCRPDLLLLDIHLPGRNGIELLRHVRAYYPSVVVIMLTNESSPFYRSLCLRLGVAWFIDKSTEFDEIPSIVAKFL